MVMEVFHWTISEWSVTVSISINLCSLQVYYWSRNDNIRLLKKKKCNFLQALVHNATDAMRESRVPEILNAVIIFSSANNIITSSYYLCILSQITPYLFVGK